MDTHVLLAYCVSLSSWRCSDCDLTVHEIIARITKHQEQYACKYVKKKAAEDEYYASKRQQGE